MARGIREPPYRYWHQGSADLPRAALDLEGRQMRTIGFGVLMFIVWTAFYVLAQRLNNDLMLLGAFGTASLVSLTALAFVARK